MDSEAVAAESPNKIIKFGISPLAKLSVENCNKIADKLGGRERGRKGVRDLTFGTTRSFYRSTVES